MKRGDIGPIGDDIPSIFPIVAGVLLFMGTVIYADSQLSSRNDYLELEKAGTGLAYVAISTPYLTNQQFQAQCDSTYKSYAATRSVNFLITMKKFCKGVDVSSDIFSIADPYPGDTPNTPGYSNQLGLACFDPSVVSCNNNACVLVSTGKEPTNFQAFDFPLAVDCTP